MNVIVADVGSLCVFKAIEKNFNEIGQSKNEQRPNAEHICVLVSAITVNFRAV